MVKDTIILPVFQMMKQRLIKQGQQVGDKAKVYTRVWFILVPFVLTASLNAFKNWKSVNYIKSLKFKIPIPTSSFDMYKRNTTLFLNLLAKFQGCFHRLKLWPRWKYFKIGL